MFSSLPFSFESSKSYDFLRSQVTHAGKRCFVAVSGNEVDIFEDGVKTVGGFSISEKQIATVTALEIVPDGVLDAVVGHTGNLCFCIGFSHGGVSFYVAQLNAGLAPPAAEYFRERGALHLPDLATDIRCILTFFLPYSGYDGEYFVLDFSFTGETAAGWDLCTGRCLYENSDNVELSSKIDSRNPFPAPVTGVDNGTAKATSESEDTLLSFNPARIWICAQGQEPFFTMLPFRLIEDAVTRSVSDVGPVSVEVFRFASSAGQVVASARCFSIPKRERDSDDNLYALVSGQFPLVSVFQCSRSDADLSGGIISGALGNIKRAFRSLLSSSPHHNVHEISAGRISFTGQAAASVSATYSLTCTG